PDLSLNFTFYASGSGFPLIWNWVAGPVIDWILFRGFRDTDLVDQVVEEFRRARARRTLAEQRTWLAVRSAFFSLEDAKKRLDLAGLQVKTAEASLTLAQSEYKAGFLTTLDVTDAVVA